jgi:hypothetical protein
MIESPCSTTRRATSYRVWPSTMSIRPGSHNAHTAN